MCAFVIARCVQSWSTRCGRCAVVQSAFSETATDGPVSGLAGLVIGSETFFFVDGSNSKTLV